MEWTQIVKKNGEINERKWELKFNDVVLGTIYHQPSDKYAVYVSSPVIYKKVLSVAGETYTFDSFEEAQKGFIELVQERALPWCSGIIDFLSCNSGSKDV